MNEYVDQLLRRHKSDGVLVDTNILIMIVIGSRDPRMIQRFNRTAQYTEDDFLLAQQLLQFFDRLITLQSILTEVSNLTSQIGRRHSPQYFTSLIEVIEQAAELPVVSLDIARMNEFSQIGLTDTAILDAARNGHLVLTDDLPLYGNLESRALPVLNFTHLRTPNLLS